VLLHRFPDGQNILALTLGHTVLGKTGAALDISEIMSWFTSVSSSAGDQSWCPRTWVAPWFFG